MAISLAECSLPHEVRVVDLQNKPADFLAAYARGCSDADPAPTSGWARAKVPVLEVDDDVLLESGVIVEYLDDLTRNERTAWNGFWLDRPRAARRPAAIERARGRLWATIFPQAVTYIPILKAEAGSEEEAEAVLALREGLRSLDRFLRDSDYGPDEGPFLHGAAFTSAEACTAPFALRFMCVLPGLRPDLDPAAMMREDGLDRLLSWFSAVTTRGSCVQTAPPPAELVDGYVKLLERMKGGTQPPGTTAAAPASVAPRAPPPKAAMPTAFEVPSSLSALARAAATAGARTEEGLDDEDIYDELEAEQADEDDEDEDIYGAGS